MEKQQRFLTKKREILPTPLPPLVPILKQLSHLDSLKPTLRSQIQLINWQLCGNKKSKEKQRKTVRRKFFFYVPRFFHLLAIDPPTPLTLKFSTTASTQRCQPSLAARLFQYPICPTLPFFQFFATSSTRQNRTNGQTKSLLEVTFLDATWSTAYQVQIYSTTFINPPTNQWQLQVEASACPDALVVELPDPKPRTTHGQV